MLGLLLFENKLKHDAVTTIITLQQANIDSCIITGDNIYVAIQTAILCRLISQQQQVVILEGQNQNLRHDSPLISQVLEVKKVSFLDSKFEIETGKMTYEEYLGTKWPIVVDNSFLGLVHSFT